MIDEGRMNQSIFGKTNRVIESKIKYFYGNLHDNIFPTDNRPTMNNLIYH